MNFFFPSWTWHVLCHIWAGLASCSAFRPATTGMVFLPMKDKVQLYPLSIHAPPLPTSLLLIIIHPASSASSFQMTLTKGKCNCCPSLESRNTADPAGMRPALRCPCTISPFGLKQSPSHAAVLKDCSGCQHCCMYPGGSQGARISN